MAQERKRDIDESPLPKKPPEFVRGKSHFLGIGIDEYIQPRWRLNNCVRDVTAVRDLLIEQYDFEKEDTKLLLNGEATFEGILRELDELFERMKDRPDDSLVLMYSGHGENYGGRGIGALIPADATSKFSYLNLSHIKSLLDSFTCRHIVVIFDSCFSGLIFQQRRAAATAPPERYPSRFALTSGRNTPVSDGFRGEHSPFVESLLFQLKENDGLLGANALAQSIIDDLDRFEREDGQEPDCGPFSDSTRFRGQYYFHPRAGASELPIVWEIEPEPPIVERKIEPEPPVVEKKIDAALVLQELDKVVQLVASARFEEAIKLLRETDAAHSLGLTSELVLLSGRFEKNKRETMLGFVSYQEGQIESNRVTAALLDLLNTAKERLPKEKPKPTFKPPPSPPPGQPPLLVVLHDEAEAGAAKDLKTHLALPIRSKSLRAFFNADVKTGDVVADSMVAAIDEARVVAVLVSPRFFANEENLALLDTARRAGKLVVPVLFKDADLSGSGIEKLKPLPTDKKPIHSSPNPDRAWVDVVKGLQAALQV